MIVVDTTVIADLLFNGEEQRRAARLLLEQDPEWICLDLVRYELGNVAWKYGRFASADPTELQRGLKALEKIILEFVSDIQPTKILSIAIKRKLTFYDASHVWLAETRSLPLYTSDKEILENCPETAQEMPISK